MEQHKDATLINALGGPAKVAELLHYDKAKGGVQRVHNWRTRGIPSHVKVARPDLFMVDALKRAGTQRNESAGDWQDTQGIQA